MKLYRYEPKASPNDLFVLTRAELDRLNRTDDELRDLADALRRADQTLACEILFAKTNKIVGVVHDAEMLEAPSQHLVYVNMQKRGDGEVYADMNKTDERIYFTREDAQAAIDADPELAPYRHVVPILCSLPDDITNPEGVPT